MTDKPKDDEISDVNDSVDSDDNEDSAIDTSVALADITVIDLEHIISDLEKENPNPDLAAQASRKRLEELLEKKRAEESLKDFDDYDLDG